MKNLLKNNLVSLALIVSFAVGITTVYATVTYSGNFPTTANNFQDNDIINAGDWNNIENAIGTISTTSKSTLFGRWNDLFASTTMPQITTLANLSITQSQISDLAAGTFSWTPTTNYGATANATSTPIWFQGGLQASSTSYFVYASSTAITATNFYGTLTGNADTATNVAVGGITGLGTGVATALAVNVGTAGAPVVNGGVLGTPSSGTVTNLTGTASININGTVGATTPNTGVFTNATSTNATTTTMYVSSKQINLDSSTAYSGVISPVKYLTLSTATSTTWTATTSAPYIPFAVAPFAGTIRNAQCKLDSGFLDVDIYHTSTHLPLLLGASSTVGTVNFSSNNTFTAGEVIYGSFGTSTTATTLSASCTLSVTQTI